MGILLWLILFEDISLLTLIGIFLLSREKLYMIVALVTLLLLFFTNILLFRGNHNEFLLLLPPTIFAIATLAVYPYTSKSRIRLSARRSKFLVIFLALLLLFSIIASSVVAFGVFFR